MPERPGAAAGCRRELQAAVSGGPILHELHFGRIHQTLRVTPAMEAGATDDVWSVEEMA